MTVSLPLAVVIPTLNEAAALPALLDDLVRQRDVAPELIVADGGSDDATLERARAAGASVVTTARGRGAQMNAGAARAQSPMLLFLHADSRLPDERLLAGAIARLRAAGAPNEPVAGHFPLRFQRRLPGHERTFRFLEAKTALARPYTINGDQGLMIGRTFFDALGGFDTGLPFLEDQRIAARITAQGRWVTLPGHLGTSARRFEREGVRARLRLMALIMGAHAAGMNEFFVRAPGVYRHQHEVEPLRLSPFLDLLADLLRGLSPEQRRTRWHRAGRFVRENAWQLALMVDVLRGRERTHPCLDWFDRRIAPALDRRSMDVLATFITRFWVMGLWRGWYRLRERRQDRASP